LREFCTKNEILFIADEVQSGFGRTGKFFAFEHASIEPDIVVMAKGLGSGVPISGIATRREIMADWQPGTHGGTYGGGSAISSAAALATVQVLQEENLVINAAERGEQLRTRLRELQTRFPTIGDVRGLGLMVGVELTTNSKPDKNTAKALQAACLERNLLILTCGTYENVIRWIPPLIVTEEQINSAVDIFREALEEVAGK
jgi:4-aminobutyrate aminotransferase